MPATSAFALDTCVTEGSVFLLLHSLLHARSEPLWAVVRWKVTRNLSTSTSKPPPARQHFLNRKTARWKGKSEQQDYSAIQFCLGFKLQFQLYTSKKFGPMIVRLYSALVRTQLEYLVSSFGPLPPRSTLRCWSMSRRGQRSWRKV